MAAKIDFLGERFSLKTAYSYRAEVHERKVFIEEGE